jgi:CubicO group peptidase (beta-lactamase class C family)
MTMSRWVRLCLSIQLFAASASPALAQPVAGEPAPPSPAQVEEAIGQIVARWDVPGASVAVVKDGEIVLARGYGVRALGETDAVDADTLFYIASITKSFTATALGILAAEGRLDAEAPIDTHLPELAGDAVGLGDLTAVDLLSHRTGYGRADLLLFAGLSDHDVVQRMARLAPVARPRERFTYQNQMYVLLGELLAVRSGMPWSQFVETRLLGPLGMESSNADGLGHVASGSNMARPHVWDGDQVVEVDLVARGPTGAGGINSTARDLADWLRFHLGDGTGPSGRIVPGVVMNALHTPNTSIRVPLFAPNANLQAYALGWFVQDHDGLRVVQHGGSGEGWSALVWMVPDLSLGIVVLTNLHDSLLPYAIAHEVTDLYHPGSARDWAEEFRKRELGGRAAGQQPAPAGAPLDPRWNGTWRSPVYGEAVIGPGPEGTALRYGTIDARLAAVDDRTASLIWSRRDLAAVVRNAQALLSGEAGEERLTLVIGGERFEFER